MKARIVNGKSVLSTKRFDGSYHNAEVNVYNLVIEQHSTHRLKYYCTEIFTSGRNKRVYTSKEYGYPFLSNSDVVAANPFLSCKYSSRKYGYDESAVLRKGMILTGRVGAIGQTAFVPEYLEKAKAMGSDNIIRICVKPEYKNGFIYAYLASKIGNLSFWKHATGGVQPFITDAMVGELPIPNFPESFQKEVDDLIQESSRLREEAAEALEEAKRLIEELFPEVHTERIGRVCSSEIFSSLGKRFEASFHQSLGKEYDTYIKEHFQWEPLSKMASVSRPDLFKRNYVKNGLMFLGGRDIFLSTPKSDKFVSKTKTPDIPSLVIKEGTILMPRSGTIGEVAIATSQHAQKLASEDVIRISADNILRAGYLYAFLSSSIGKALIQRYIFGSVIQHVEPHQLNHIPVPILIEDKMNAISDLSISNKDKLGKAGELENKAISMVEQEIEKWNN